MSAIIEVDGCDPCPFRDGQRCYHPSLILAGRRIETNGPEAPEWCDLSTGPTTITLRKAAPCGAGR